MGHPNGGKGNQFAIKNGFTKAYNFIGADGFEFRSTTGETLFAKQGNAIDNNIKTIIFIGENSRHGNVCSACWGYRSNCSQTYIGQCVEALDKEVK